MPSYPHTTSSRENPQNKDARLAQYFSTRFDATKEKIGTLGDYKYGNKAVWDELDFKFAVEICFMLYIAIARPRYISLHEGPLVETLINFILIRRSSYKIT